MLFCFVFDAFLITIKPTGAHAKVITAVLPTKPIQLRISRKMLSIREIIK